MKESGEIQFLRMELARERAVNAELRQTIAGLEEKLNFVLKLLHTSSAVEVKKDSHNSSLPPSSDLFGTPVKKNQSLRVPSTRPSGGQLGHEGTTLDMCQTPDVVIDLTCDVCMGCGASLSTALRTLQARRQVVELPPIVPIYKEYRQYSCTCSNCQAIQSPVFPLGVSAPIQYGGSIESLLSYLSVYQYLPYERLQHLFKHVFSLPLSQGTIGNIIQRVADKCTPFYDSIKTDILNSAVVGADETSMTLNGKKAWVWTWQNTTNTYIVPSENRGDKTVQQVFENGLPLATLVSDRYQAQLNTASKDNQICLAHLKRDLIYLEQTEKHPFATQFNQFISQVFAIKKQQNTQQKAFEKQHPQALLIEQQLDQLLALTITHGTHGTDGTDDTYKNTKTFQFSMIKHRHHLLPCLYNLDIPPDNNGSERAIRMIKVKQKISGQFKSGHAAFCTIRSVIDTLKKRGQIIIHELTNIVNRQPKTQPV